MLARYRAPRELARSASPTCSQTSGSDTRPVRSRSPVEAALPSRRARLAANPRPGNPGARSRSGLREVGDGLTGGRVVHQVRVVGASLPPGEELVRSDLTGRRSPTG